MQTNVRPVVFHSNRNGGYRTPIYLHLPRWLLTVLRTTASKHCKYCRCCRPDHIITVLFFPIADVCLIKEDHSTRHLCQYEPIVLVALKKSPYWSAPLGSRQEFQGNDFDIFFKIFFFDWKLKCLRFGREIALEILNHEPIGSFLVRNSTSKPGCFALSLRVPKDFQSTGIAHYLILETHRGYKIKVFIADLHLVNYTVTFSSQELT